MCSATPILPEERLLPNIEWMQQHADLARFCRRLAIPLALLTQWAGTAPANAGRIDHTQAAIGALFATHGQKATALLDTGASHRAGEENQLR